MKPWNLIILNLSSTTLHDPTDDENLPLADNFDSGSRAALSGGTTLIVDNVNPKKGQSLVSTNEITIGLEPKYI